MLERPGNPKSPADQGGIKLSCRLTLFLAKFGESQAIRHCVTLKK
jgi:hypothetical protein